MNLFYARVSTEKQNEERQIRMAKELNIAEENIFIDKKSGKNCKRENLQKMLDFMRKGDIVYTESISRLSRSTKDLLDIVEKFKSKEVEFISLKEKIDTTTAQGKFTLTIFGALAELEREYTLERQKEGIAIAKEKKLYKGRQPKKIDKDKFKRMCEEWRSGQRSAVSIQREFEITATTFYRWEKEI